MNSAEEHEWSTERRQHQRYEIDTELRASLAGMEPDSMMRGRSLDISEAGIAGVFTTAWEIGTPVRLEFSLPMINASLRVGAVVRSRSGYRCGFEFVNLSPEQRETVNRACRTLALLE